MPQTSRILEALEPRRLMSADAALLDALPGDAALAVEAAENDGFDLLSAMRRQPEFLGDVGIGEIYVSYGDIWPSSWTTDAQRQRGVEEIIRRRAREIADAGHERWVLDIEHWHTDLRRFSEAEVDAAIDKFVEIVDWAKDERPELEIGFYGVVPTRDFWTPVDYEFRAANYRNAVAANDANPWPVTATGNSLVQARAKLDAWHDAVEYLRPIAEASDFIVPSLYTFYDAPASWQQYAGHNLDLAASFGKPVLPFLWPEYHNSSDISGFLPGDDWRAQLDFVRDRADGLIIWRAHAPLDVTWDWWQETVEFAAALRPTEPLITEPPVADEQDEPAAVGPTPRETPVLPTEIEAGDGEPSGPLTRRPATRGDDVRALRTLTAIRDLRGDGFRSVFTELRGVAIQFADDEPAWLAVSRAA